MNPYMKLDEIKLFQKYLNNSTNYLEFGSGGSTYYAAKSNNIKKIVTTETDNIWIDKIKKNDIIKTGLSTNRIIIRYVDIKCTWWKHVSWSTTIEKSYSKENWPKYSKISHHIEFIPDLILIDGRFRVVSALECLKIMDKNSILLFHDYTIRKQYHIIEQFFDKIENINTLCVFKKKKNIDNIELEKIIEKYRLVID